MTPAMFAELERLGKKEARRGGDPRVELFLREMRARWCGCCGKRKRVKR